MGSIVGGILAAFIVGLIVGKFAWKNTPPIPKAVRCALIAYLLPAILYGFGAANGGSYVFSGLLIYAPGALLFGWWYHRHLSKHWTDETSEAEIFS